MDKELNLCKYIETLNNNSSLNTESISSSLAKVNFENNGDLNKRKDYLLSKNDQGLNSFHYLAYESKMNELKFLVNYAKTTGEDFIKVISEVDSNGENIFSYLTDKESEEISQVIRSTPLDLNIATPDKADKDDDGFEPDTASAKPEDKSKNSPRQTQSFGLNDNNPKEKTDKIGGSTGDKNLDFSKKSRYFKYIPENSQIEKLERGLLGSDLDYAEFQNFLLKAMGSKMITIPNNVSVFKSNSILKEFISRLKSKFGIFNPTKNKDGFNPRELKFLDRIGDSMFILPDGYLGSIEKAKYHKQTKNSDFKSIPTDILNSKENYIDTSFLGD